MDQNHLEQQARQKALRRTRKKKLKMRMSGKRTREIPKLWRKRNGH